MTITNKVTNRSMMPGITPVSDVPDAPTIGTATAGDASATVTFTAAVTGGTPTLYRAISSPDSIAGTNTVSPITVSGLTNGTSYTFTVRGENSTANGPYSSATTGVTPQAQGSYYSIATQTIGAGGSGTITFSSIPQTYKHLQIRGMAQTNRATFTSDLISLTSVNGTSANLGQSHSFWSQGGSQYGQYDSTPAGYWRAWINSNANTSTLFSGFVLDITDYTNTNKAKTFRGFSGYDQNGSGSNPGIVSLSSTYDTGTSAITSLTLAPGVGSVFNQNSQFALYGIKG